MYTLYVYNVQLLYIGIYIPSHRRAKNLDSCTLLCTIERRIQCIHCVPVYTPVHERINSVAETGSRRCAASSKNGTFDKHIYICIYFSVNIKTRVR